ncbi:MAG TPA: AMP-binding protein [Casimicrobiaceae bacterium]|nr:AMP-binding protein [Casimicrobiaceae bacterium]
MDTPIATNALVLGRLLERHARYRPRHPAVVVGDGAEASRLTYAEFNACVNRWANALAALGVVRGERVATILPNSLELLANYWACAKLGAAAVPLSPLLLTAGLVSLLDDARPRVVLSDSAFRSALDQVRPQLGFAPSCVLIDGRGKDYARYAELCDAASAREPQSRVEASDVVTVMYTSGTTGLPKGIMHTHFIRAMYAGLMATSWRMTPESVVLHTGAIVFNGAMTTMLPAFYCGGRFIVHRRFDANAAIEAIATEGVTHTMLVPSQIIAILNSPRFDPARLGSLEMILSLGAPLHKQHKDTLNRVLPNRFYELYGLTEGFITVLDRADATHKAGSVGVPPPFYDMRIIDEAGTECAAGQVGEIVGRGPITMPGYLNRPELTAQTLRDGWLYTGDLGYVDDDGYLYLVDRKKDMIDSGGVKVYPKDIEEIAVQHPAVREVAVFGIPHDKWGETPIAAVVLSSRNASTAVELCDWINARVAARYQRVDRVVIMDDFPRNAAGKTLKREMREPYWTGRSAKI